MNKAFMYLNGMIIVSTEEGMKPAIPYVDHVEDILILENEIEYLEKTLAEDEKKLDDALEEKASRRKLSKHISLVGSALGVAASFGGAQLFGLSHTEMVSTIMGEMSEFLAFAIPMSVGEVVFVQGISFFNLKVGPSPSLIRCYQERIAYEKEMLDILRKEQTYLTENVTLKNDGQVEEMVSYPVRSAGSIQFLKEAITLREYYGYDSEKCMKAYREGGLEEQLTSRGFGDIAIMDFIGFLNKKIETPSKLIKK